MAPVKKGCIGPNFWTGCWIIRLSTLTRHPRRMLLPLLLMLYRSPFLDWASSPCPRFSSLSTSTRHPRRELLPSMKRSWCWMPTQWFLRRSLFQRRFLLVMSPNSLQILELPNVDLSWQICVTRLNPEPFEQQIQCFWYRV
ncbi:hypothetical protein KR059_009759 [Drosophila kikkawai]|nr:hypothetical protein KR059_009759 [Drosophila kikkawai]